MDAGYPDHSLPTPPAGSGLDLLLLPDESTCMDLSLMLFAEGIDSIPVASSDHLDWGIWIEASAADYSRRLLQDVMDEAQESARFHRTATDSDHPAASNFANGWILGWLAFLALIFLAGPDSQSQLKSAGILNDDTFHRGEFHRLITSICLHKDLGHLALNLVSGWGFTSLSSWRHGSGVALLGALIAGAAANAGYALLRIDDGPYWGSLGASGMIFASLGLCIDFPWTRHKSPTRRYNPFQKHRSLIAATAIIGLFGLSPDSNWLVHVGGFVCGAAIAWGISATPDSSREKIHSPALQSASLALFLFLIIGSWLKAG